MASYKIWREFQCKFCYNVVIKCMSGRPKCDVCKRNRGSDQRMSSVRWHQ